MHGSVSIHKSQSTGCLRGMGRCLSAYVVKGYSNNATKHQHSILSVLNMEFQFLVCQSAHVFLETIMVP